MNEASLRKILNMVPMLKEHFVFCDPAFFRKYLRRRDGGVVIQTLGFTDTFVILLDRKGLIDVYELNGWNKFKTLKSLMLEMILRSVEKELKGVEK